MVRYTIVITPQLFIKMALLIGWRFGALIGGLVGLIGLAVYPAVIYPMLHIDEYSNKII